MKEEKVVNFDYEAEIKENPYRYKTIENLINITNGHIGTARTYFNSRMYKDAKEELIDAYRRIDLFIEDIKISNLDISESDMQYLDELVRNAEIELFGEAKLRSRKAECQEPPTKVGGVFDFCCTQDLHLLAHELK